MAYLPAVCGTFWIITCCMWYNFIRFFPILVSKDDEACCWHSWVKLCQVYWTCWETSSDCQNFAVSELLFCVFCESFLRSADCRFFNSHHFWGANTIASKVFNICNQKYIQLTDSVALTNIILGCCVTNIKVAVRYIQQRHMSTKSSSGCGEAAAGNIETCCCGELLQMCNSVFCE